jgi:hypothetical protein
MPTKMEFQTSAKRSLTLDYPTPLISCVVERIGMVGMKPTLRHSRQCWANNSPMDSLHKPGNIVAWGERSKPQELGRMGSALAETIAFCDIPNGYRYAQPILRNSLETTFSVN